MALTVRQKRARNAGYQARWRARREALTGLESPASASMRATWRGRFGTSKLTWPPAICEPRKMSSLVLKRASASRPFGEWNDDDYDVLADATVVSRIMKVHAAPEGSPWMWTLAFGHHAGTVLDDELLQCCFAGVESGGSRKDCAYRNVWAIIQSGMHYVGFAELASVVFGGLRIITGLTQKRRTHRARGADASGFSQLAARAPQAAMRPPPHRRAA